MKVIFLDTNLFQQCRDLKELPWKEIAKEDDLLLLVPKTVEDEIDRQKAEGNTRRGKRARKTSAFFREIVSTIYSLQEPSQESISKYTKDEYPGWVATVRKFFEELATNLELCRRHTKAIIAISNEGSVPAENVIIELTCQSGLQLRYLTKEAKTEQLQKIKLPSPPHPPEAKILNFAEQLRQMSMGNLGILGQHSHLASSFQRESHDKNAFYFKPHRPPRYSNNWTFECDEFRHQVEPENFDLTLFVPPELTTQKASFNCRITAKNLPSPSTITIPVKISYEDEDTMAIASNILEKM